MKSRHRRKLLSGFTVIELLTVVTLAGVLLVIGVPSFQAYQRNSELTSAANSLVSGLYAARGEAMKRARYAMVMPKDGSDWNSGWVAFVDNDKSGTFSSGDITVQEAGALPGYLSVSGKGTAEESPPYIMFDASGYAKTKSAGFGALALSIARTDVSSNEVANQTRRIVIAKTGRVRTCKPAGDSTCTESAEE